MTIKDMTRTIHDTKQDIIKLYAENDAKYGIWGWCTLNKAGNLVDHVNDICERVEYPVCVEIGVYSGKSIFPVAMELKRHGKGIVHAIDPWSNTEAIKGYDGVNAEYWGSIPLDRAYNIFLQTIHETKTSDYIDIVKSTSDDAPEYTGIDLVYIDGQHTEQAFKDAIKYATRVNINGYCYIDDIGWGQVKALPFFMEQMGFMRIHMVDDCMIYKRISLSSAKTYQKFDWVDDTAYKFDHYPFNFNWSEFPFDGVYTIQREILQEKVYRWFRDVKEGDTVLDLGVSTGAWVTTILDQKPKRVIAVDGNQTFIDACYENITEQVERNNVEFETHRCILLDEDTPPNRISPFVSQSGSPILSFKNFREQNNLPFINFLKMDIEGGEYNVLADENIDWILNNVEFISMELHLRTPNELFAGKEVPMEEREYHRLAFIKFRDNHLRKFKNYKVFSDTCEGPQVDLSEKIWDNDWVMTYNRECMMYLDNGDNIEASPLLDPVFTMSSSQQNSLWIVDNFYKDPYAVREFALRQDYHIGGIGKGYIGNRTHRQFLFPGLKEKFESIMGKKITNWQEHGMNGRFQWCVSGQPQVWHCDSQMWGGMLYLTPDAPYAYGTTMYANKKTRARTYRDQGWDASWHIEGGDPHLDGQDFEPVDVLGNVFNRLVIFDAACIHSSSGYFGVKKDDCRLWQMFFFDTES